jgi:hypothetical protein
MIYNAELNIKKNNSFQLIDAFCVIELRRQAF